MRKIVPFFGAVFAVFAFSVTGAQVAVVSAPEKPVVEQTLNSETRATYLKHFTDRFYLAAKLTGIRPFTMSEKQHLEAAASRFADGAFQVFQKNQVIPVVVRMEKDPQISAIMEKMLQAKDQESFLVSVRELSEYIHDTYPELHRSEVIADLQICQQAFLKDVEEIPSMPKLAEKSVYTFWDSVLVPGFR